MKIELQRALPFGHISLALNWLVFFMSAYYFTYATRFYGEKVASQEKRYYVMIR